MLNQIIISVVLILIGTLSRTVWHIGPNFELVTACSILAGFFIKDKRIAVLIPLVTMVITDSIIGNTNIFWFTWSAYVLMPFTGALIKRFQKRSFPVKLAGVSGAGLASLIIFFLWTNLGVVLTTNMYEKSLTGLISSYINALPFLKPQLISTMLALPVLFILSSAIKFQINYGKVYFRNFKEKYL